MGAAFAAAQPVVAELEEELRELADHLLVGDLLLLLQKSLQLRLCWGVSSQNFQLLRLILFLLLRIHLGLHFLILLFDPWFFIPPLPLTLDFPSCLVLLLVLLRFPLVLNLASSLILFLSFLLPLLCL